VRDWIDLIVLLSSAEWAVTGSVTPVVTLAPLHVQIHLCLGSVLPKQYITCNCKCNMIDRWYQPTNSKCNTDPYSVIHLPSGFFLFSWALGLVSSWVGLFPISLQFYWELHSPAVHKIRPHPILLSPDSHSQLLVGYAYTYSSYWSHLNYLCTYPRSP